MRKYDNRFGLEFEFSAPSFKKMKKIVEEEIQYVYGKNKLIVSQCVVSSKNNNKWHFKKDATTTCEIASPISGYEDLPDILDFLKCLQRYDIKITHEDGFHIHIETEDVSKYQLLVAWLQIERIIFKCFPTYRRKSDYCVPVVSNKKEIKSNFFSLLEKAEEHHSAFSLYYFSEKDRKTVEFRLSEGTIDTKIVSYWLRFYMHFIKYAKSIDAIEQLYNDIDIFYDIESVLYGLDIEVSSICDFLIERYYNPKFRDSQEKVKKIFNLNYH